MNCTKIFIITGVMAAALLGSISQAPAAWTTSDDLFYNYYVPPVGSCDVGAAMYPCPRPTPPLVGHTYVTYQGLMPQEFLYPHHRCYVTKHPDAPPTHTHIHWSWW